MGCAAQGISPSVTQYCYSSLELYQVNPKTPLGGQSTAEAAVGGALCVEKYNGADEILYYSDTAVQSSDIFLVSAGKKVHTYAESASTSVTLDSAYDKGDNIAAFSGPSTSPFHAVNTGFLSIPAADFSGKCNDFNYATFEENVAARTCSRELLSDNTPVYQSQCENDFSVAHYVTNMYISAAADLRSADDATNSNVVPVTIASVKYHNLVTNVVVDVTSAFKLNNCATAYRADYNAYNGSAPCRFAGNIVSYPNVPRCQNMVMSVAYTVTHSSPIQGKITAVSADIIIADIPRDVTVKTQAVVQTFGINFYSFGGVSSAVNGNLVARAKSGNPGYLIGKPVLLGTQHGPASPSNLNYVVPTTEGLQVATSLMQFDSNAPSTFGSGTCTTSSTTSGLQSVGFGYDLVTGCQMQLTRDTLRDLCCSTSSSCTAANPSAYADNHGPYFLALPSTDNYVGVYGNADPLDANQWIKLSKRISTLNPTWNNITGVCSNMLTGLHYKFLVASTGEKSYPQSKIVAAEVEQLVSDLRSNIPYRDTKSTQSFPLEIIVSFIHKDASAITGYTPAAPPVLFKVPRDVFYPFFMSPASQKASTSLISIVAPLLCIAALLGVGTGAF